MPIGIPIRLKRFGGWYTLSEIFLKNQLLKADERVQSNFIFAKSLLKIHT